MKPCPFCAEEIQDAAIKCKHCGSMLAQGPPSDGVTSVATDKARIRLSRGFSKFLVGLLFAGGAGYWAYHLIAKVDSGWGWVLAVVALVAFVFAILRDFKCSFCGHENMVAIYRDNEECTKCKVLHIVDWE